MANNYKSTPIMEARSRVLLASRFGGDVGAARASLAVAKASAAIEIAVELGATDDERRSLSALALSALALGGLDANPAQDPYAVGSRFMSRSGRVFVIDDASDPDAVAVTDVETGRRRKIMRSAFRRYKAV